MNDKNGQCNNEFDICIYSKYLVAMDLNDVITISKAFFLEKFRIHVIKTNNTEGIL